MKLKNAGAEFVIESEKRVGRTQVYLAVNAALYDDLIANGYTVYGERPTHEWAERMLVSWELASSRLDGGVR